MQRNASDRESQFEQWLLDSGRSEQPPARLTEEAWERFAKTGAHVAAGASSGALLSRLGLRHPFSSAAWLGAGLVAGSALTLTVLGKLDAPPEHAPHPAIAVAPVTGDAPSADRHTTHGPQVQASTATSAELEAPLSQPAPEPQSKVKGSRRPAPAAGALREARRAPGSTLAAEVRALDAVRREIEAGQPERALAAVEAFHVAFPRAQLAADAEGLAIDALLAQRDRDGAARRAKSFLIRYPGDPHATRFAPVAEER